MRRYWDSLDDKRRRGVLGGAALIVVITAGVAIWCLRERFVPLATDLSGERLTNATRALDAAKLPYHVTSDGASIEVPEGQLGRARIELSGVGGVPTQGFELFNNTDFTATDFSQRINYQRALQGELVRTIQSMDGVRAARVHVFLPESSMLRKQTQHPSAAVAISMTPGQVLAQSQVRGIQRLVAAAIPDIKPEAITLVDFSGRPLSRASAAEDGGDFSTLEGKKDADTYLENKVRLLLSEAFPGSDSSISVDATLDKERIKVTTDQALPTKTSPDSDRDVGVVAREKQTTRSLPSGNGQQQEAEVTDSEYEYHVTHRLEETLQTPGSIRRLSVAVVVRGAGEAVSQPDVERLVARAAGIQQSRGDELTVLLLPAVRSAATNDAGVGSQTSSRDAAPTASELNRPSSRFLDADLVRLIAWPFSIAFAALLFFFAYRRGGRVSRPAASEAELIELAKRVKAWMREEDGNVRP